MRMLQLKIYPNQLTPNAHLDKYNFNRYTITIPTWLFSKEQETDPWRVAERLQAWNADPRWRTGRRPEGKSDQVYLVIVLNVSKINPKERSYFPLIYVVYLG